VFGKFFTNRDWLPQGGITWTSETKGQKLFWKELWGHKRSAGPSPCRDLSIGAPLLRSRNTGYIPKESFSLMENKTVTLWTSDHRSMLTFGGLKPISASIRPRSGRTYTMGLDMFIDGLPPVLVPLFTGVYTSSWVALRERNFEYRCWPSEIWQTL